MRLALKILSLPIVSFLVVVGSAKLGVWWWRFAKAASSHAAKRGSAPTLTVEPARPKGGDVADKG